MKKIIAKIIISLAVGLIVGEIFGNKNEIVKYYTPYHSESIYGTPGAKKAEISAYTYSTLDKEYQKECLMETHFNYRSFLTYSIVTTSVLLIVFFTGDLRKRDE